MMKHGLSKSSYIKIIIALISLTLVVGSGLLILHEWEKERSKFPQHEFGDTTVVYDDKEYTLKNSVETFLVIGLDKFDGEASADSYNNDKQADFLMLFVFDNEKKQCSAIHINRDTITDVNVLGLNGNKVDTQKKQIALAHTHGNGKDVSCRNTAESVSSLLLGMKVNHYVSATMDTVVKLNDLVGGVEVTVNDDFTGIDDTLIKGEKVVLMGDHALNFVRTRYGLEDDSNSTRMVRQQEYINGLYDKFQECAENDDEFIIKTSLELSDHIVSDRSVTQLQTLAEKFNDYEFLGIKDIEGKSVAGEKFMEFYPDEKFVERMVIDLFYQPKENKD